MLVNLAMLILFLLSSAQAPPNPWKAKLAPALKAARADSQVGTLSAAFDAAWRADDARAGLELVRLAQEKFAGDVTLRPLIARALWRSGRIEEAEKLAAAIPTDTNDRVALHVLIEIDAARLDKRRLAELAKRLEALQPQSCESLNYVLLARALLDESAGTPEIARAALKLSDPGNGYPDAFVKEGLSGLPEFVEKIGSKPVNQVTHFGQAEMYVIPGINLPGVDVMINGRGPYRMLLDTGGSIMLSLDKEVADEIGLKSLGDATIRGVSGTDTSGQALIDQLKIGSITCDRVLTRIFELRKAIMGMADGVLGTGVFGSNRFTLDFKNGRVLVAASSDAAPPGSAVCVPLRIVRDAKLMVPVTLQGEPGVALLDTGADAVALAPSRLAIMFPDHEPFVAPDLGLAGGVGSGEGVAVSIHPGVDFVFGDRTYANYSGVGLDVLDKTLGPILGLQADVLAGMAMMRDMARLVVDQGRAKMWVEWLEPAPAVK